MTHLTPQEFVDALEGTLASERQAHLETCEACGREAEALTGVLREAESARDPVEPSPLFWDHFGNRVRAAVDTDATVGRAPWWQPAWRPAIVGLSLAAVAVVASAIWFASAPDVRVDQNVVAVNAPAQPPTPAPLEPAQAAAAEVPAAAIAAEPKPASTTAWQTVVNRAGELDPDDMMGLTPSTPGSAILIEELSQRELQEFVRLLKAETGGM